MRVETSINIIEKDAIDPYKKPAHGRWYVQKSICKFRRVALEKLARMQGFSVIDKDMTDPPKGITEDQNWTRYAQGRIMIYKSYRYYFPRREY